MINKQHLPVNNPVCLSFIQSPPSCWYQTLASCGYNTTLLALVGGPGHQNWYMCLYTVELVRLGLVPRLLVGPPRAWVRGYSETSGHLYVAVSHFQRSRLLSCEKVLLKAIVLQSHIVNDRRIESQDDDYRGACKTVYE